jgi:hypothetical protein
MAEIILITKKSLQYPLINFNSADQLMTHQLIKRLLLPKMISEDCETISGNKEFI